MKLLYAILLLSATASLPGAMADQHEFCPEIGTCYDDIEERIVAGDIEYICKGSAVGHVCRPDPQLTDTVIQKDVTEQECTDIAWAKCWQSDTTTKKIIYSGIVYIQPPQCAQNAYCEGDPHLMTWGGNAYDYHGECDLVLLTAPSLDLRLHIRTTRRYDYSYISTAALQMGYDRLEVSGWGSVAFNGVSMPPEDLNELSKTQDMSFFVNYTDAGNTKTHVFEIYVSEEGEKIVMKTFKDWVSVLVERGLAKSFADSSGLLGSFVTGEKLARDGESVIDDPVAFGNEWQVLGKEPMLFQSVRSPQYPEACKHPIMTQEQRSRRLGAKIAHSVAEKACEHWERKKEQCIFDVMASGDLEVAMAVAF